MTRDDIDALLDLVRDYGLAFADYVGRFNSKEALRDKDAAYAAVVEFLEDRLP